MVFISKEQQETLLLVDNLINDNKTYNEIISQLIDNKYELRANIRNGYIPKTKLEICKNGKYTFVDIRKKRNGFAYWETIKLS